MLLFYKLLYVCNTSFINSLLQSICRWPAGFKKKSHGTHELFGVFFFPLCSNTLKTATPRNQTIGKAQRCTEACRETQVWKVPVCGVWLMTEPPSDVRRSMLHVQDKWASTAAGGWTTTLKKAGMVLSSVSSGMGFPTVTWKMYSANSITETWYIGNVIDLPLRPTEVVDFTFCYGY